MWIAVGGSGGSQRPLIAVVVTSASRDVTSSVSCDHQGTGSQLTEYELVTLFPAEQVSLDSVLIVSNY